MSEWDRLGDVVKCLQCGRAVDILSDESLVLTCYNRTVRWFNMVMDPDDSFGNFGLDDGFSPDDDPSIKPLTDKELGLSFPKLPGMDDDIGSF